MSTADHTKRPAQAKTSRLRLLGLARGGAEESPRFGQCPRALRVISIVNAGSTISVGVFLAREMLYLDPCIPSLGPMRE